MRDLHNSALSCISKNRGVNNQVDSGGNNRGHKLIRNVFTCEQRQRLQFRYRIACRVRMNCCHTRKTRVQSNQQIQRLCFANFAYNNLRRPHSQRLFDQLAQRYLTLALQIRRSRLQSDAIWQPGFKFEDFFDSNYTIVKRGCTNKCIEQGSFTRLSRTTDQYI